MSTKPKRILATTDFSDASLVGVRKAVELARDNDAELLLLYVIREEDYPTHQVIKAHGFPNFRDEMRKRSESQLRELQAAEAGQSVRSQILVREGVPSAQIAEAAEELDIDLVVIATHGFGGFKRLLVGSTAERVVRLAPCQVLVVKPLNK